MNTAIVTGACSPIGEAISRKLNLCKCPDCCVVDWCRCRGIDLTHELPNCPENTCCVVHVAELGVTALLSLWMKTRETLARNNGVFIFLSSIHHLVADDAYAKSKRQQEQSMADMALWSSNVRVNCIRLGHVIGTKAWPEGSPVRPEQHLRRYVTPEEVAKSVLMFIECPSATGSILTLDSGILITKS